MKAYLDAVERDSAIFHEDASIWTSDAIEDTFTRVVTDADTSDRNFETKLLGQIAGGSDQTIQLAAEAMFVWYLKDNQTVVSEKLLHIKNILALGSAALDMPDDLAKRLHHGLAHLGMSAFHKWPQFHYVLHFARRWKEIPDRWQELRQDPWAFREFVMAEKVKGAPAQMHAFMHLVHPDAFEPVVNRDHKKQIVRAFAKHVSKEVSDTDRALISIRKALEGRFGEGFQFYQPDIRPLWDPSKTGPPAAVVPSPSDGDAVHLVVKWSVANAADTIERHKEIAQSYGSVWWGILSSTDSGNVGASALETLRSQLARGTVTYAWISGPPDQPSWRCEIVEATTTRPADTHLVPSYYLSGLRDKLWIRLRSFEETDRDWLLTHLEPATQTGKLIALVNQTNPIYVRRRSRPRYWWVNIGGRRAGVISGHRSAISLVVGSRIGTR
jgi:hypothetical protein